MNIGDYVAQVPIWSGVGLGAGGGFFVAKWFFETVLGRLQTRETRLDDATQNLIETLTVRVDTLTVRVDTLEKELQLERSAKNIAEAEALRYKALAEARGEIRSRVAEIVAADRVNQAIEGTKQ